MTVLGFDFGARRIGVAAGNPAAVRPLGVVDGRDWAAAVRELVAQHTPERLVVGLPRGLDGQETAQTTAAREFAARLGQLTGLPVDLMDEAGTSSLAEERLHQAGRRFGKEAIDAEAAAIIVQDYLDQV